MNPLHVRARNYRSFDELDLDLPAGCVAIVGENGAGKSSIVTIIDLALFGPAGRSWAPYLTEGVADTELMVELIFEHAGDEYRVRRGYSARGRGKTTVDFERLGPDWYIDAGPDGDSPEQVQCNPEWESLTLGSASDTQALVEQTIGMSRRTLRASSLLLQGDGAAFTEADPRDRKGILGEILGLDRYDKLAGFAKRDKRAAEDELHRIAGALDTAEAALADRPQVHARLRAAQVILNEATVAIAKAEIVKDELVEQARVYSVAAAQLQAAASERDRAADVVRGLDERRGATDAALVELQTVKAEIAVLPSTVELLHLERQESDLREKVEAFNTAAAAREAAKREYDAKYAQREAIRANARKMAADAAADIARAQALNAAGPGVEHCDQCGQTLGAEALASTVASMRLHADELHAGAEDLERQAAAILFPDIPAEVTEPAPVAELAAVAQLLRVAREAAVQGARLVERMGSLGKTIAAGSGDTFHAEHVAASEVHGQAQRKVDTLTVAAPADEEILALEREQAAVATTIREQRARFDSATAEHAKAEQQLERLAELEQQSHTARMRCDQLNADVDELSILERAYGRDGIPALIVENAAIPQIEVEANRILERMPTADGDTFRVELRTERALKGGGTGDTLDIVVLTSVAEREYQFFSGGEKTRLNLALRLALAQLLATRKSADSRLVVIDEPDGLDRGGKDALIEILRDLEAAGMERLYLISHDADLRESLDSAIEVVKDNRISRVVGSAVLEEASVA